jgi:catechol 2,3-dioxygenase-like lactoylglutathione lyase family enzyme
MTAPLATSLLHGPFDDKGKRRRRDVNGAGQGATMRPGRLAMPTQLDHIILRVNDRAASIEFYTSILGLQYEGEREPFSVIRVTPGLTLQLAPWGTQGGDHLAFAMSRAEFDDVFRRVVDAKLPYGDSFHAVGNMRGPGDETGSRGPGKAVYFFDPSKNLIEIRHYETSSD